ncbi:MAG: DUF3179 domain-containing protein [Cyclobacteriaceae bacterium]
MKQLTILLLAIGFFVSSCQDDVGSGSRPGEWLIPRGDVFDGGPGKDGIPALTSPQMVPIGDAGLNYLKDNDLVIVYKLGEEVLAFSHAVLDWHEIINTSSGNNHFAVTYCPLTGTTLGWNREINNTLTTFGVSGKLYNSNLIPYDRLTDTYYSQIFAQGINGTEIGFEPEYQPLMEMPYETLKEWYPNALVTSSNTGHSRQYGVYPYRDYKTNPSLLFPVSNNDSRLFSKERVMGVIGSTGSTRAYRFDLFENRGFVVDEIDGEKYLIMGDEVQNWMAVYKLSDSDEVPQFEVIVENGSGVLRDEAGNTWDAFGAVISGPDTGKVLASPVSYIGYWFAWATFYPEIEIFER